MSLGERARRLGGALVSASDLARLKERITIPRSLEEALSELPLAGMRVSVAPESDP